jgi:hypothetical protein
LSTAPVRSAQTTPAVGDANQARLSSLTSNATAAPPPFGSGAVAKAQKGTVYRNVSDYAEWVTKPSNLNAVSRTLIAKGFVNLDSASAGKLSKLVYIAAGSGLPGTIPSVAGSLLNEAAAAFKTYNAAVAGGNKTKISDAAYDLKASLSDVNKYVNKYVRPDLAPGEPRTLT